MRKLDPRTKLLLLVVINVVMMTGKITGIFVPVRIVFALIPFFLMMREKWFRGAFIYFGLYLSGSDAWFYPAGIYICRNH